MLFPREEKAIPKFGDLSQRTQVWPVVEIGHWTMFLHSESFEFTVRSSLWLLRWYRVFWHFRWIQKWLQSKAFNFQCPCGSFRKFSIKVNFTLNPPIPRSPCLDSDRMHACTRLATRQNPLLRSRIYSSLNDKWAACRLRTALISILQVLKVAFRRGLAYTGA